MPTTGTPTRQQRRRTDIRFQRDPEEIRVFEPTSSREPPRCSCEQGGDGGHDETGDGKLDVRSQRNGQGDGNHELGEGA